MNDAQLALVAGGVLTAAMVFLGRKLVRRADDDVKAIRVPPSLSAALAALDRGNVRAARAIAGVLGRSAHPPAEIELVLGRCDEEDGNFLEAAAHFEKGPPLGVRFGDEARHRRVFCLAVAGRWQEAEAVLGRPIGAAAGPPVPASDPVELRALSLLLASRRDSDGLAQLVRASQAAATALGPRDRRMLHAFDPRLVLPGPQMPVIPEDAAWVERVVAAARART